MPPTSPALGDDDAATSTKQRSDQEQRQLDIDAITANLDKNAVIRSKCQCGRLQMTVPIHAVLPLEQSFHDPENNSNNYSYKAAVDCHCMSCRKYHVVAFCSYLLAVHEAVQVLDPTNSLRTYRDSCSQLGPVVRMQCGVCRSKLATRPLRIEARHGHQLLLNMGPIDDQTLPKPMGEYFQNNRQPWQLDQRPCWSQAAALALKPRTVNQGGRPMFLTGSCTCGQSKYRVRLEGTTELQNCYCRLCRRASGGPYQTWVPFDQNHFEWVAAEHTDDVNNINSSGNHEPPKHRYVPHGQRHVCSNCGGVLTIVYNGSDEVWPAAGGFDEDSLPAQTAAELGQHLHSIIHISCRYKQSWYSIPRDGNPRIPEAG
ncbi:hypothetical protein ACA910_005819 [Epithemia clementina (nom. ined.)]